MALRGRLRRLERRSLAALFRSEFSELTPAQAEEVASSWLREFPREPMGAARKAIAGLRAMSEEELLTHLQMDEIPTEPGQEQGSGSCAGGPGTPTSRGGG